MTEDEIQAFKEEIHQVCMKHKSLAAVIVGCTHLEANKVYGYSLTLIPIPPKDHEDDIMRDVIAKKMTDLVLELSHNVYG